MTRTTLVPEPLLTPSEVAALWNVDPRTVTRWAKQIGSDGKPKLPSIRTIGGHRRFRESVVRALLEAELNPPAE